MNQASGLLLIGFALAGYMTFRDKPDEEKHLAEVTRIAMLNDVEGGARPPSGSKLWDSSWEAAGAVMATGENAKPRIPMPLIPPGSVPDSQAPIKPWTTVVSTARQELGADNYAVAQVAPDSETRSALTLDIQVELTRIGCYAGPIDGRWDDATRRAMGDFLNRSNASLPTVHPDYVLLALAQSQKDRACGVCSEGDPAQGGATASCAAVTPVVVADASIKQRRSAKHKKRPQVVAAKPATPEPEQPTVTAEVLPWTTGSVSSQERSQSAIRQSDLQGRMSVGGPVHVPAAPNMPATGTSKFETLAALDQPRAATLLSPDRNPLVLLPSADAATDIKAAKAKRPDVPVKTAALPAPGKKAIKKKAKRGRTDYYYSSYGTNWGRRNAYRRRGYDNTMTLWGMF